MRICGLEIGFCKGNRKEKKKEQKVEKIVLNNFNLNKGAYNSANSKALFFKAISSKWGEAHPSKFMDVPKKPVIFHPETHKFLTKIPSHRYPLRSLSQNKIESAHSDKQRSNKLK